MREGRWRWDRSCYKPPALGLVGPGTASESHQSCSRHVSSASSTSSPSLVATPATCSHAAPIPLRGYFHPGSRCMSHHTCLPKTHSRSHEDCAPTKVPVVHHRNPRRTHPLHDLYPFLQWPTKRVHATPPPSLDAFPEYQGRDTRKDGNERGHLTRTHRGAVDETEHT